ncbi:MAG: hypothetical protein A2908_00835 [Candidatus Staskawiczbacteria bacterium RIFCSPLOWO2_01_FULL_38_12b]|uniref:HNH nuclease domain-containing protein n=1 Tax=Candidatus Staskawiczbacteria bacterium RIFCSPLOWO2_01_FULL_38_12b TaxID=1802214 RepID=A0A1G2IHD6_9BACT|nr:MAG: hypothetical protein A2908_00835 [Candidatus Staskawiczbacteria bacterium RIFCSPLOWO2_01_FULL_38_12b]
MKKTIRYSKEWRKKVSKSWFKKGLSPHNKGIPMSLNSKRKLSKSLKGKKAWNKGIKMTEEQKNYLSQKFKGIHRSTKTEFKKGQFIGNKNPAKRSAIRKKISDAKIGLPHLNQRGKNHGLWKGGVTPENEKIRKSLDYIIWRKVVFSRDNWTCQKCKIRGGKIHSHHIHNFADFSNLRTSINNGITLCKNCHKDFHKVFGLKNTKKSKLKKFLRNRPVAK